MRIDTLTTERKEAGSLRYILEIVRPGNSVLVEQVENGSSDRLVSSRRGKLVSGGHMPKRSSSQKIRAVRKRRPEHRGEVAIVDGEFLCQIVVERNVVLVVEPHRLVISHVLGSGVELSGQVVDSDEAITQKACKSPLYECQTRSGRDPG